MRASGPSETNGVTRREDGGGTHGPHERALPLARSESYHTFVRRSLPTLVGNQPEVKAALDAGTMGRPVMPSRVLPMDAVERHRSDERASARRFASGSSVMRNAIRWLDGDEEEEGVRTAADDFWEAAAMGGGRPRGMGPPDGPLDLNDAMVRDFQAAVMAGDPDHLRTHAAPRSPASSDARPAVLVLDEDGIEEEAIEEGETPFFLESPKMAKFDNFVEDEGMADSDADDAERRPIYGGSNAGAGYGSAATTGRHSSGHHAEYTGMTGGVTVVPGEANSPLPKALADAAAGSAQKKSTLRTRDWEEADAVASSAAAAAVSASQKASPGGDGVLPFALDADFDYDNVTLSHRLGSGDLGGGGTPAARKPRFDGLPETPHRWDEGDSDGYDAEVKDEDRGGGGFMKTFSRNADERDVDDAGRASSGMLKRAKGHYKPSPPETPERPSRAAGPDDGGDGGDLVKIRCGKCSVMLRISASVPVFRCPKCDARLRNPGHEAPTKPPHGPSTAESVDAEGKSGKSSAHNAQKAPGPPARVSPAKVKRSAQSARPAATPGRTTAADRAERAAEVARSARLAAQRAARAELERHIEFSRSLEDVIDEMGEQLR